MKPQDQEAEANPGRMQAVVMPWRRYRFKTEEADFRPIVFPPPGPYWCTGQDAECRPILVAYIPRGSDLFDFWPDAQDIEMEAAQEPLFTSRFPKPDWWA